MHYPFIPIKPEQYWIRPNKPKSYYYKDIPLIGFSTITSKPIEYIIQKLAKIQKDNAGEELICANSCIYKRIKIQKTERNLQQDEKQYQNNLRWYKVERDDYAQHMKEYEADMIQYKKDLVTYEKYTIQKQMDELTEKAAKLGLKITKK